SLIAPRAPSAPLFPCTTLFRSIDKRRRSRYGQYSGSLDFKMARSLMVFPVKSSPLAISGIGAPPSIKGVSPLPEMGCQDPPSIRSEEHTSELQSRENLVCRLLL